jgi:hypothetical protein
MNQPNEKNVAGGITGTFYIHFLDGFNDFPLAKADRFEISDREVRIFRNGKEVERLGVVGTGSRWGQAENENIVLEYLKYEHNGRTDLLFGRLGKRSKVNPPTEDPPVGVWGADSQPPKGDDGQGNS